MNQLTIFDVQTPAARSIDPETSHIAAEKHTKSGKRYAHKALVLKTLRREYMRYGRGFTGGELTELINRSGNSMDHTEVVRRLSDMTSSEAQCLMEDGKAVKRRCRVRGSMARVWVPIV